MRPAHPCLLCAHATPSDCAASRRTAPLECTACGCFCLEGRSGTSGRTLPTTLDRSGPHLPEGSRHLDP